MPIVGKSHRDIDLSRGDTGGGSDNATWYITWVWETTGKPTTTPFLLTGNTIDRRVGELVPGAIVDESSSNKNNRVYVRKGSMKPVARALNENAWAAKWHNKI